jgi:hypothetical protein
MWFYHFRSKAAIEGSDLKLCFIVVKKKKRDIKSVMHTGESIDKIIGKNKNGSGNLSRMLV